MDFSNHIISHVVKKLNRFCGMVYLSRTFLTKKQLHKFYRSKIEPTIRYALLVYDATTKTSLNKILLAQKRLVRAIFCRNLDDSTSAIFNSNKNCTVFEFSFVEIFKEFFNKLGVALNFFITHIFLTKEILVLGVASKV